MKKISEQYQKTQQKQQKQNEDNEDILNYRKRLSLKQEFEKYPLLLCDNYKNIDDYKIFVETRKLKREELQFLSVIAEKSKTPQLIHLYKITKFSLYTASIILNRNEIIDKLKNICKNECLPLRLETFINEHTQNYGAAKLKLINNNYYLYLKPEIIEKFKSKFNQFDQHLQLLDQNELPNDQFNQINDQQQQINSELNENVDQYQDNLEMTETHPQNKHSPIIYKIKEDYFKVSEKLIENNIPLIQEYDFKNDNKLKQMEIEKFLKTQSRDYQESALQNIFIEGKARSGLVILPCGAGKTLVGILVTKTIKRDTLIACDRDISVNQWHQEFLNWCKIDKNRIIRLTGKLNDFERLPNNSPYKQLNEKTPPIILITTYSMLSRESGNLNAVDQNSIQKIKSEMLIKEWGLFIADEVHTLPAKNFQKVLKKYKFKCKIGLTATPYREDRKIFNLYYMIGPKLYEENLLDLINAGYLARPYLVEVRCKLTQKFEEQYQEQNKLRMLLHTGNPKKFNALKYLINKHEKQGDKILVFCDRVLVLEYYADELKKPVIHGKVETEERQFLFNMFNQQKIQTLFVSRVGDTAINLPAANVGIQIAGQFSSRRQEVQRLGRIMRPKEMQVEQYNAFFYTLVSKNTDETAYCQFRQKCLINQGLDYEIVNEEDLYNTDSELKQDEKNEYLNPSDEFEIKHLKYLQENADKDDLRNKEEEQILNNED